MSLKVDHIAKVHAYTTSRWLVMEMAQGNLKEMCARSLLLMYKENYALLEQAAARMSCAHGHDPALVHSDVKTAIVLAFGNRSNGIEGFPPLILIQPQMVSVTLLP